MSVFKATRTPTYRLSGTSVTIGEGSAPEFLAVPFHMSGAFLVENGVIVTPEATEDIEVSV